MSTRTSNILLLVLGLAATSTQAQDAATLNTRSLAATCAACHGTDGRSSAGSAVVSLAGMPRDAMLAQLKAFKDGSRPATVMHQLTKGYSEQQLEALATYFSTLKR